MLTALALVFPSIPITALSQSAAWKANYDKSQAVIEGSMDRLRSVHKGRVTSDARLVRHGLTTTYKSGKQRLFAWAWYRILQAMMVLNATLLCAYIVGFDPPPWLLFYNHYSIAVHFCAALIGVSAVRDSDAVVENRMLELKAETARQDLITARKTAAIGSPLVLVFAKLRGFFDSVSLSFRLLFRGGGFARDYAEQIEVIARTQYGHLDDITQPHGKPFPRPVTALPKGPAQRP
jgi:hypothetical protein